MNTFCPLASGSKGNSLFLGSKNTKLLIDAGISFKQLKERLDSIGESVDAIEAVIITHEHSDHIRGLETLVKRCNIPIFANAQTARAILSQMSIRPKFKIFSTGESFSYGDIEFHPFSVQHDTLDPVGFTAQIGDRKLGICTDTGFITTLIKHHLKGCHCLYLESNHEVNMVHSSKRPAVYKQRVLSKQGHLSNEEAATLLKELVHEGLKHVYLAHLSEECNHPDLAIKRSKEMLETSSKIDIMLEIAHQNKPSCKIVF